MTAILSQLETAHPYFGPYYATCTQAVDDLLASVCRTPPQNFITVLYTDGRHAGKTFHKQPDGRIKETAYTGSKEFTHRRFDVGYGIDDLYALLQAIEETDTAFLIQGEVSPEFRERDVITRTIHTKPEKQQVAMIRPVPDGSKFVMIDFDKIDLPPGMTKEEGVEMLVQTLPDEFHDVSYCYQLSSSCGIKGTGYRVEKTWNKVTGELISEKEKAVTLSGWGKISAHVYFVLSKKHADLHIWGENFNATRSKRVFDPAPLRTSQPNYCVRPKFSGMEDPIPTDERSGFVRKSRDEVDLVWIDAPPRTVAIDGIEHTVGAKVSRDGKTYTAAPNLADWLAEIGGWRSYRAPLKSAIGYYFRLKGRTADPQEIKTIIRTANIDWGDRDYLGDELDDMVAWFVGRDTHEPLLGNLDDVLRARLIVWRADVPKFFDGDDDLADWVFETEETGLQMYYIEAECGFGKTEWLVTDVSPRPRRLLFVFPRISMVREAQARLLAKHPTIEQTHLVHTIYTDKENDLRDEEDAPDDEFAANGVTVTRQVEKFHEKLQRSQRAVILFITHAALAISDWSLWGSFDVFVDEVPEPYQTQTRDFKNTAADVKKYIEVAESETNYYRVGLTDAGWMKTGINGMDGSFDDNEQTLKGLLEAIRRPNTALYAHKDGWEDMASQEVLLMRMMHAGAFRHFRSVTFMGDEFRRSTLAMAFEKKYGVEWLPHPDWHPTRTRTVPLAKRVRLHYFASKEENRGSLTGYGERKLIHKLIAWFKANVTEQTLITTNTRFKHLFEKPNDEYEDVAGKDGMYRRLKGTKIPLLWVPPKMAGTDIYKTMTSVAFFAAMRPGRDEVAFVEKALLFSEEETIRWRQYNALYQFVMRICPRLFESDQIADVYVFDEWEADYLRERFGGCLEFNHIKDAIPYTPTSKGGRPKGSTKTTKPDTMSAAERMRKMREQKKGAKDA